mmetsp:Transcript_67344/g.196881  ORF Transcript_67344/g.196881 Transcript_67344/m.196881 type:complete len:251 (+) Transcript_67344:91-843(+)
MAYLSEAEQLVSGLRGALLRSCARSSGRHFQGLAAAARSLRCIFEPGLARKLIKLDTCYNIMRHIDIVSCQELEKEVMEAFRLHAGGMDQPKACSRAGAANFDTESLTIDQLPPRADVRVIRLAAFVGHPLRPQGHQLEHIDFAGRFEPLPATGFLATSPPVGADCRTRTRSCSCHGNSDGFDSESSFLHELDDIDAKGCDFEDHGDRWGRLSALQASRGLQSYGHREDFTGRGRRNALSRHRLIHEHRT